MQSHNNNVMHHNPNNNNNNNPNKRKFNSTTNHNNIDHQHHHHNKKNNNILTHNSSNTFSTTTTTVSRHGSTTQACAACKYQRRKCASDCVLAPYFPHDRQQQFLNAHRLFGVSNIVKIVKHLDPPAKDHAMRTIIFQSDARAADPVGGCHRMIRDLERRISLAKAELEIVLHHLAVYRAAHHQQQQGGESTMNGEWRAGYVGAGAEDEVVVVVDDVNNNSWGCNIQENNNNVHGVVHHQEPTTSSSFVANQNQNHLRKLSIEDQCNDDINPILDQLSCDDDVRDGDFNFDSHGNIIPSNDPIFTEEKGTFKEDGGCFPYVQDHHDLKAAATFFSLTNCNI